VPRLDRLLPGVAVLRGYRRSWLGGDVLAGLTVAAYLVPQVMAYGSLAGLPPVAGLWAILAPLALSPTCCPGRSWSATSPALR
jgi:SulP family sulfate permease